MRLLRWINVSPPFVWPWRNAFYFFGDKQPGFSMAVELINNRPVGPVPALGWRATVLQQEGLPANRAQVWKDAPVTGSLLLAPACSLLLISCPVLQVTLWCLQPPPWAWIAFPAWQEPSCRVRAGAKWKLLSKSTLAAVGSAGHHWWLICHCNALFLLVFSFKVPSPRCASCHVFEGAIVNIGSNTSIVCLGSMPEVWYLHSWEAEVAGRWFWARRKMSGLLCGLLFIIS